MFTSFVPGWTTKDIYIGLGYYFSKNWVDTQIIELDGNHENTKIMQGIKMGKNWEIIKLLTLSLTIDIPLINLKINL